MGWSVPGRTRQLQLRKEASPPWLVVWPRPSCPTQRSLTCACLQKTWQETRKRVIQEQSSMGVSFLEQRAGQGIALGGPLGTHWLLRSHFFLTVMTSGMKDTRWPAALQRHLGRPVPASQSRTPGPSPPPGGTQ